MIYLDLGLIDYQEALLIQEEKIKEVQGGHSKSVEYLIFCRHPSVVTLGKKTQEHDFNKETLSKLNIPYYHVKRGGRATYHGAGQLVIYPILNLGTRCHDLHRYLVELENFIVTSLKSFNITCFGRALEEEQSKLEAGKKVIATGVWYQEKKLASIGVAIRRGITYHGVAINIFKDPLANLGISPCGFTADTMTSLEEILSLKPSFEFVQNTFYENFFSNSFFCK